MAIKRAEAIEITRVNNEALEKAINILAFARIKNKMVESSAFDTECDRIERCLEWHYKKEDHSLDYFEYCRLFIKKNMREMLGNGFNDPFLN